MSIRVVCKHNTRYSFDRPVSLTPHVLRLRPAPHSWIYWAMLSLSLTSCRISPVPRHWWG